MKLSRRWCRSIGKSSCLRCSTGSGRDSTRSSGIRPSEGRTRSASANPEHYLDWLKELHEESHGNADLVAHFYRRCFNLLRRDGAFGLIATNTIGQGDTRSTGLRWICTHGGEIYNARKRFKWPGRAAVVVSVVHVVNGAWSQQRVCSTAIRSTRSPLTSSTPEATKIRRSSPLTLARASKGSIVLGMGFTFDDTDTKGVATLARRDAAADRARSAE